MHLHLVLGSQLFDPEILKKELRRHEKKDALIFMREDRELCTYFRFHKQKIYLFLTAMRYYRQELIQAGYQVHYETLEIAPVPASTQFRYEDSLGDYLKKKSVTSISYFEIEDKFFESRISALVHKMNLKPIVFESPMFLSSRHEFDEYLQKNKKPFMKTFYESQRKRLKILVDKDGRPDGGQWSFDAENRKALPKNIVPPDLPQPTETILGTEVKEICVTTFSEHPGNLSKMWLPVNRVQARDWLALFLEQRFAQFGPYEDAIPAHSEFLFHSVLTSCLNTGLLTPHEVVTCALSYAKKHPQSIALASLEGFIRQVIGWREFIRGIYQKYSELQECGNFFNHQRALSGVWYGENSSGVPPLDRALDKVREYGYAHHIERLMIFGSLMVLLEIAPKNAYRWFMEMFVDSSDWVMGPNVYGMALFSDGGIFATKPYICGSNYYRKMSGEKPDSWCDGVDGLYWSFIEKHYDFFSKNPRLSMIARGASKLSPARKKIIYAAADRLRDILSCP